jgi:hypothetical protein
VHHSDGLVLLCKKNGETIDLLPLYFEVARDLVVSIFLHFGIEWVVPQRVVELLACLRSGLEVTEI